MADALADRNAVFLVNHGIVAVGPDLPTATITAMLLEEACSPLLLTRGHGGIAAWTDDSEALEKRERIYSLTALAAVWKHLLRGLEA